VHVVDAVVHRFRFLHREFLARVRGRHLDPRLNAVPREKKSGASRGRVKVKPP
jgi:hypothetical protein